MLESAALLPAQAVVGRAWVPAVECVLYAPSLRYLLIVLKGAEGGDGGREALLSRSPDPRQLEAAYSGGELAGVIVTAAGALRAASGVQLWVWQSGGCAELGGPAGSCGRDMPGCRRAGREGE